MKKAPKKSSKKKKAQKKTPAKKKASLKKASSKKKASPKKKKVIRKATAAKKRKPSRKRVQPRDAAERPLRSRMDEGSDSAGQSGDLQGLSGRERADSESVDELVEEGNAFEADVVEGVQDADDHEGEEVHTHEAPEDDVPKEYLDED
jgi:hypothetical protein